MCLRIFRRKKGYKWGDMGEEEIRARLELEKIWISRLSWAYFVIFSGYLLSVFKDGINLMAGVATTFAAIGLSSMMKKITNRYIELAKKLDELKKSDGNKEKPS